MSPRTPSRGRPERVRARSLDGSVAAIESNLAAAYRFPSDDSVLQVLNHKEPSSHKSKNHKPPKGPHEKLTPSSQAPGLTPYHFVFHPTSLANAVEFEIYEYSPLAVVWEAGALMCQIFAAEDQFGSSFFTGKQVVELGAGTGLTSLTLATLGATVVATDMDFAIPTLKKNVDTNAPPRADSHFGGVTVFDGFAWEDTSALQRLKESITREIDVIVTCDTLYALESHEALANAIDTLSSAETITYVAYSKRSGKEKGFSTKRLSIDNSPYVRPEHYKAQYHVEAARSIIIYEVTPPPVR